MTVGANGRLIIDTAGAAGDVFKVAVDGATVKYYKNGVLVYTSTVAPTYPRGLDTTLLNAGSRIGRAHYEVNDGRERVAAWPRPDRFRVQMV